MSAASVILVSYFGSGVLFLVLFDIITGRIRRRLSSASIDTQVRMTRAGLYLGVKTGIIMFVVTMWLFWPAVLVGAVRKEVKWEEQSGNEENES